MGERGQDFERMADGIVSELIDALPDAEVRGREIAIRIYEYVEARLADRALGKEPPP